MTRVYWVERLVVIACVFVASGNPTICGLVDRAAGWELQRSKQSTSPPCPALSNFKPVGVGGGGTSPDGRTHFSVSSYKASDGAILVEYSGYADSPNDAGDELQRWIKSAKKIIVNGRKVNRKGQVLGRRIEALMPVKGSKDSIFAVIWTSGRYFYAIGSRPTCRQVVLAAEKNIDNRGIL